MSLGPEADSGGKGLACGWISDRWGMRWQIVPKSFDQMLGNLDAASALSRGYPVHVAPARPPG